MTNKASDNEDGKTEDLSRACCPDGCSLCHSFVEVMYQDAVDNCLNALKRLEETREVAFKLSRCKTQYEAKQGNSAKGSAGDDERDT